MSETADVVILGGGVMGTSIAFHLAQRGAGKIVVLEKSHLGAASSGKSGAIIRQYYSHALLTSMARHGLQFYKDFPEIVGGPPVFTHSGLVVVSDAGGRAQLEANVSMLASLGVDAKMISPAELKALDARVSVEDDEVAAYESEAGYCEALQVVASLASAARDTGVVVREGTAASGLILDKQKVVGVATSLGTISTGVAVLAAGGWSAALARAAGSELPVKACRTQVALFRRPSEFGSTHAVFGDLTNQIYFRPLAEELTHVGNVDPREEENEVDPDHYKEVADDAFASEMREKLERRFPAMRRAPGRGGYGALYSVTPDWQPIIDRLPGVEGAFCAAGFSGHGFKMAPAVGKLVAEFIVDGRATSFDIHPLRASRFADGEPFGGKTFAKVMG